MKSSRMLKFLFAVSFVITSSILIIPGLYAEEKMRIAVMDLKADGVPDKTARTISSMLRSDLVNDGHFKVLERSQMDSILKEQGFQQTGCTDQECAVEMGRLLSVKKILIGEVSEDEGIMYIAVRIVDVEKGEVEFAEKEVVEKGTRLDIITASLTKKLVARITKNTPEEDTRYSESNAAKIFSIEIKGEYLIPSGDFADMAENGYGSTISFRYNGLFIDSLSAGIAAGYRYYSGKDSVMESSYNIPLLLNMGFNIPLAAGLSIYPEIAAGYAYNSIDYEAINKTSYELEVKTESVFEPLCEGNIAVTWNFTGSIYAGISAGYGAILESDGTMQYMTLSAMLGMKF